MSIFRQILLLVGLSWMILLLLSFKIEQLIDEKSQSLRLSHMLNTIRPLYLALMKGDIVGVKDALMQQGYHIKVGGIIPIGARVLYSENGVFGGIVVWSRDGEYGLLLNYLDDVVLASIGDELRTHQESYAMQFLLAMQFLIMFVLYIMICFILRPIKQITHSIKAFEAGDYHVSIPIQQKNELGMLAESFNNMAKKIASLLYSKELFLRSAGHELRTPIAKGKLAVEVMSDIKEKPLLKDCFDALDRLTDRLLTFEYLQYNTSLKKERFFAQTLVFEALVASMAEEEHVELKLQSDFAIIGDKQWLVIALKNLIENALKYSHDNAPIIIELHDDGIKVCNKGRALENNFEFYLNPFVRGHECVSGYGLGLSIVKMIVELHHFELQYEYILDYHCIEIRGIKAD